jgi:hypothetical protein
MPLSPQALPGRRAFIVVAALATAALACAPLAGAAIPQGNLVQNPGAELPAAPVSDTGVAPPTGWETSPHFTVMAYGRTGFPPTSVSEGIGGGTNFFAGGPTTATSVADQFVDISGSASEIDAGHVRASLSAYLGGVGTQADAASVTVTFNSGVLGDGNNLGSPLTVGPVTPGDRHNETTLLKRDASATVPTGARSALVAITATYAEGLYNDGYADNVSLALSEIPPPPAPPPAPPRFRLRRRSRRRSPPST